METPAYPEAISSLNQRGYALVPILTKPECDAYIDQMWSWIEGLGTGVRRDDPATWGSGWPGHVHGIFKCHGVGQAPFMWRLRTEQRILDVFSYLWRASASELLCSFDGCSIMRPRAHWRCKWQLDGRIHVDLSNDRDVARRASLSTQSRVDTPCVQGLITLADMDETTGTFACVPGSHRKFRNRSDPPSDWYRLDKTDLAAVGAPVRLRVPAGTLVLWDSRTAHCGAKPMPVSEARKPRPKDPNRFRYVCYLSYLPRRHATASELKRRRAAFEDGRTTSHWAYPVKLNARRIRFDKRSYTVTVPPLESYLDANRQALARLLVGYEPPANADAPAA